MADVTITINQDVARFLYCTVLRSRNVLYESVKNTASPGIAAGFASLDMALTFVRRALPEAITHDDAGNPLTGNEVNKPPPGGG